MHVSLKHARRVVLGVAVGALLLAAAPGSGQADIIQICVSPKASEDRIAARRDLQYAESSDHMG